MTSIALGGSRWPRFHWRYAIEVEVRAHPKAATPPGTMAVLHYRGFEWGGWTFGRWREAFRYQKQTEKAARP